MTMLKGVNKTVLELSNPDSEYFERVVLYLKPNLQATTRHAVKTEAESLLTQLSPNRPSQRGKDFLLRLLGFLISAGVGGLLTAFWLK